jgi:phage repressor protein C with HTH and peptisase S24 domain
MVFTNMSTSRLSTGCLFLNNQEMHPSVTRLLNYARKKSERTVNVVKDFAELQVRLQVSSATMTNWKKRGVSKEGAISAEQEFGCSVNWVLTGEGAEDSTATREPEEIDLDAHPGLERVRSVRLRLQAGVSGFAIEPDSADGMPIFFRSEWLRSRGFKAQNLLAIKVTGQSMEPTLFADDVVVINTVDNDPRDGRVYAINYEGEAVIKRMVRDSGTWWLSSDNPDQRRFPRKECRDAACIIVGQVIHRQSEQI